jgi:hypothetical protein
MSDQINVDQSADSPYIFDEKKPSTGRTKAMASAVALLAGGFMLGQVVIPAIASELGKSAQPTTDATADPALASNATVQSTGGQLVTNDSLAFDSASGGASAGSAQVASISDPLQASASISLQPDGSVASSTPTQTVSPTPVQYPKSVTLDAPLPSLGSVSNVSSATPTAGGSSNGGGQAGSSRQIGGGSNAVNAGQIAGVARGVEREHAESRSSVRESSHESSHESEKDDD